jgi:hypothetical protein
MADHHDRLLVGDLPGSLNRIGDHRFSQNRMQDFGQAGLHASSLTRRQDNALYFHKTAPGIKKITSTTPYPPTM